MCLTKLLIKRFALNCKMTLLNPRYLASYFHFINEKSDEPKPVYKTTSWLKIWCVQWLFLITTKINIVRAFLSFRHAVELPKNLFFVSVSSGPKQSNQTFAIGKTAEALSPCEKDQQKISHEFGVTAVLRAFKYENFRGKIFRTGLVMCAGGPGKNLNQKKEDRLQMCNQISEN